jgi:hypothetical protein
MTCKRKNGFLFVHSFENETRLQMAKVFEEEYDRESQAQLQNDGTLKMRLHLQSLLQKCH